MVVRAQPSTSSGIIGEMSPLPLSPLPPPPSPPLLPLKLDPRPSTSHLRRTAEEAKEGGFDLGEEVFEDLDEFDESDEDEGGGVQRQQRKSKRRSGGTVGSSHQTTASSPSFSSRKAIKSRSRPRDSNDSAQMDPLDPYAAKSQHSRHTRSSRSLCSPPLLLLSFPASSASVLCCPLSCSVMADDAAALRSWLLANDFDEVPTPRHRADPLHVISDSD